jgi:hypothetical protein
MAVIRGDSLCAEHRLTLNRERADDGIRTHDIQLGKLALYQLSYVRR